MSKIKAQNALEIIYLLNVFFFKWVRPWTWAYLYLDAHPAFAIHVTV